MSQVVFPHESKFQELLEKRIPLRFSCITKSGWPVILSLWFIEKDGTIYCATKKNSKVIQYLKENPKCAFEIASEKPPYIGIRGNANVILRKDVAADTLKKLITRYLGNEDSSLAKLLLSQSDNEVAIQIVPFQIFTWDYSDRMKGSTEYQEPS